MVPKLTKLAWFTLLLILVPTLVKAQGSCVDAPNNSDCAANMPSSLPSQPSMSVFLKSRDAAGAILPNVRAELGVGINALGACDLGKTVATKIANAIKAASSSDYTCEMNGGTTTCAVQATDGQRASWAFRKTTPNSNCGFTVDKLIDEIRVTIGSDANITDPLKVCRAVAQTASGNLGNEVELDLLPQYFVQVNPSGVHGVVTFKVFHNQGGANPRTFQVNTTSFGSDLLSLHNAIKAGFDGTGLGLITIVRPDTPFVTHFPEAFSTGPVVRISNAQTVIEFGVKGLPGQRITQETSVPPPPVPALSPWGLTLLVGVLLLASLWMLRRRILPAEG